MVCGRGLAVILLLPLCNVFFGSSAKENLGAVKLQHQAVLDQMGAFVMLWSPLEEEIHVEIQVATTGFVGIGFSPSGGMKGADIILAWVDDVTGELHVHDRHATGKMIPLIDKQQDITVAGGYQNDTHTVLRFSRPWNTCDDPQDMKLSGDTTRVIWAYSYSDPEGDMDMGIHDHRGTKSIYLREPRFSLPKFSEDVKTIDFVVPEYIPIIQDGNHEQVHHMLLNECHLNESSVHYEQWLSSRGRQCLTANMPASWYYCSHTIIAWAIGSEGEMFPEHVGLPLGEEHGGSDYYMIQIHYDNPKLKTGVVDSSGLRLFYTDKPREIDGGVIMVGSDVEPTMIIPPRQRWKTIGICPGECTEKGFPKDGIRIFQGLLHAHLLGRAISIKHIRNGVELPTVFKDMNYDFNYQQQRVLKEEMVVLPGDTLIVECDYDSTKKAKPTFGGEDTDDEMCLGYLTYYPRMGLSSCLSAPEISNIYKPLGVQNVYYEEKVSKLFPTYGGSKSIDTNSIKEMDKKYLENPSGEFEEINLSFVLKRVIAKSPKEYENKTLFDLLHDSRTWQDPKVLAELQELMHYGTHQLSCRRTDYSRIQGISETTRYPDFLSFKPLEDDECQTSQTESYVRYDVNNEHPSTSQGGNKKEETVAEDQGNHKSAATWITNSVLQYFFISISVWIAFMP